MGGGGSNKPPHFLAYTSVKSCNFLLFIFLLWQKNMLTKLNFWKNGPYWWPQGLPLLYKWECFDEKYQPTSACNAAMPGTPPHLLNGEPHNGQWVLERHLRLLDPPINYWFKQDFLSEKSKIDARGPQNGCQDLGRASPLGIWVLQST